VKTQKVSGLARALSKMGYCSRSRATELIKENRVKVNGRLRRDPEFSVRMPADRIEVDGSPIEKQPFIYLMMNKPRGLVTTASDEKGRDTIYSLLEKGGPWVAPVGRLDKASEGLLLLTNDSDWAARITDPASHVDKTYHVQIDRVADHVLVAELADGCMSDGEHLRAKRVRLLRHGQRNSWLEMTLDEGKNRQIRRMLEVLEVRVLQLVRVSIGPLELGDLKKGGVRPLMEEEKRSLDIRSGSRM
jgi:23S rRNA pseudouridine2605 synthase